MHHTATNALRLSATVLALLLAPLATSFAATPNPERAAQLQKQADDASKQAEGLDARVAKATGEVAEAAKNAATACRLAADAGKKLAAAVGAGNDDEIKAAQAGLSVAQKQSWVANEQLNVRQTVASFQPADSALEALTKATPEANKPLLDATLAAKKKATEAGATFYAVITPDASSVDVEVARDVWSQSTNALELANMTLNFANDRARMAASKGAELGAAVAKLAELAKIDDERLATRKAQQAASLQYRALERQRAAAVKEFETLRNPPKS